MAFAEDLTLFTADFGDDGTLAGAPVRGIFDAPGVAPLLGDVAVGAVDPQFQLPTVQVPASPTGAVLVLPQGTFKVREHLPDGTGMSLLMLTRVSA